MNALGILRHHEKYTHTQMHTHRSTHTNIKTTETHKNRLKHTYFPPLVSPVCHSHKTWLNAHTHAHTHTYIDTDTHTHTHTLLETNITMTETNTTHVNHGVGVYSLAIRSRQEGRVTHAKNSTVISCQTEEEDIQIDMQHPLQCPKERTGTYSSSKPQS